MSLPSASRWRCSGEPESVAAIWRQRFTRQPGDFVAEMVLVQSGDRYLVDHVLVF
jgi:hypothetical protein